MTSFNPTGINTSFKINNIQEYNMLFRDDFQSKLDALLTKGNFILGDEVKEFEIKMQKYIGTTHCISLNSGTNALELAFEALKLQSTDEVIIQANAYIACAFGALKSNAKLILIDCDKNGVFNIDEFEKHINNNTKAVLVVHLYGDCCNMDKMKQICEKHSIFLIEDCAQSQGTKYNGKMTGSFGDLACFSFYPSKNLGALGDGGAICTNNDLFYDVIIKLRNLGCIQKYKHDIKGTNSRLDTLQASFLLTKFDKLTETLYYKQKIAALYKNMKNTFFSHIENDDKNIFHSYHLFVIKLNPDIDRDYFMSFLNKNGIETIIHYKIPFYKSKAFKELNHLVFTNTEELSKSIVSIPIYNTLKMEDALYICKIIDEFELAKDFYL